MKVGLVVPVYNRPEYLRKCLDSLEVLTINPDITVIVDDGSTDSETLKILSEKGNILKTNSQIYHLTRVCLTQQNKGVRAALSKGIEYLFFKSFCDIVINLDSDAIVRPDFIEKLLKFYHPDGGIVSGFNCRSNPNEIIGEREGYCLRTHANGINMCFNRQQYEKYIKPSLAKVGNWDYNTSLACQADKLPFVITVPSVVQHIGMVSSMGHTGTPDMACDFKQLSLPGVTLFGIDAHDPKGLIRAAEISQQHIEFGAVDIITERLFTGREAYSKWILKELAPHIKTSHVLVIHPDGYVLNWQAWNPEWLQYDYIGATWWYKDNMNVGNGGFSLRSKRLMDIMTKHELTSHHPEDHIICRLYRESLEQDFGIRFAPEEVANKFSIEAYNVSPPENKYTNQFGFHSCHVDMSHLPESIRYKKAEEPRQTIVQTHNRPQVSRHAIRR